MGEGDVPMRQTKFELPNVAGLRVLIDKIQDVDLPLLPRGHDANSEKLKIQIELVIASPEEKEDLKILFDNRIIDVLVPAIDALPSERQLRQGGQPEGVIVNAKSEAKRILDGISNLPFFHEYSRQALTDVVRRLLVQKDLIQP